VLAQSKLVEEALSDKLQEDDVVVKVTEHMQVQFNNNNLLYEYEFYSPCRF